MWTGLGAKGCLVLGRDVEFSRALVAGRTGARSSNGPWRSVPTRATQPLQLSDAGTTWIDHRCCGCSQSLSGRQTFPCYFLMTFPVRAPAQPFAPARALPLPPVFPGHGAAEIVIDSPGSARSTDLKV